MARDGMLARYSCIVVHKSGYDDKLVCEKKNRHAKRFSGSILK